MSDKLKVLVLADYGCGTGFGQVASNIMQRIAATGRYDITVIGINYDPAEDIDVARWPGRIIPAVTVSDVMNPMGADVYGRQKVLNELGKGIYDIFFSIQDTFILQTIIPQIEETREALQKKFATVFYYPIDAQPKPEWITDCVSHIDFPVAYTEYAKAETLKVDAGLRNIDVIYHGTNLTDFHHIDDPIEVATFRKQYFAGHADGRFLLTNINRNQPRKDVTRSFMILKELKRRGRDVLLYLHMAHNDAGGNLLVLAEEFGFELNKDFILPSPKLFTVNQGLPLSMVNLLYNASDAVLSTTLGEGWGLSITEAMATKTPVIAPDNTSLHEMMADNRGILVPSGNTPSHWVMLGAQDNERVRPLMDVEKAADAIERVMDGQLPDLDAAYDWATANSWDNLCTQWVSVFDKAADHASSLTHTTPPQSQPLNRAQRRRLEKEQRRASVPL